MFGSMMRDMERDPIFGGQTRMMNRMMNSFFGDNNGLNFPFGGFPGIGMMPFGPPQMNQRALMGGMDPFGGFPHMGMTNNLSLANQQFGGPSFSSMSVMSMQTNGQGAPIVYQASSSTRQGPGGVKETRKTVCDSRSGLKKMSVGRHLGDRGHVVEREENLWTGQREENEELLNLDFEEKPDFDREWRNRVHGHPAHVDQYGRRSITGPSVGGRSSTGRNATYTPGVTIEEVDDDEETSPRQDEPMRALPPIPTVTPSSSSSHPHHHHHARRPKDRRQPRISKNRSKKL